MAVKAGLAARHTDQSEPAAATGPKKVPWGVPALAARTHLCDCLAIKKELWVRIVDQVVNRNSKGLVVTTEGTEDNFLTSDSNASKHGHAFTTKCLLHDAHGDSHPSGAYCQTQSPKLLTIVFECHDKSCCTCLLTLSKKRGHCRAKITWGLRPRCGLGLLFLAHGWLALWMES